MKKWRDMSIISPLNTFNNFFCCYLYQKTLEIETFPEVDDGTADFVTADISMTSSRANAFAFTIPWLNLGISILYIKPRPAAPSLIAFLDPFTPDVSFTS